MTASAARKKSQYKSPRQTIRIEIEAMQGCVFCYNRSCAGVRGTELEGELRKSNLTPASADSS